MMGGKAGLKEEANVTSPRVFLHAQKGIKLLSLEHSPQTNAAFMLVVFFFCI